MLVVFKPTPRSILNAYLAGRVRNAKPVEDTGRSKYYFEETIDADSMDYDALYKEHKERFGGLDFLEDQKKYEIIEDEVFWASRFNSPDRFQLIFRVLEQIEREGTKYYLSQSSPESKEMKDRIRRVTGEYRRAKTYISFSEDRENKAIIGKASLEHHIIDLVLRHHAKRKPGYKVAIVDDDRAHIVLNDEILVDSKKKFPDRPGRRDAQRYWLLLSDLRHLQSKKDPVYADGPLPMNYWKWVSEGANEEGPTPSVTLDDYA